MRVASPRRRHPLHGDHSRPILDGVFTKFPLAFQGGFNDILRRWPTSELILSDRAVSIASYGSHLARNHSLGSLRAYLSLRKLTKLCQGLDRQRSLQPSRSKSLGDCCCSTRKKKVKVSSFGTVTCHHCAGRTCCNRCQIGRGRVYWTREDAGPRQLVGQPGFQVC